MFFYMGERPYERGKLKSFFETNKKRNGNGNPIGEARRKFEIALQAFFRPCAKKLTFATSESGYLSIQWWHCD